MEIQSAFQAGVQGFNNAQKVASDAAQGIVQATTTEPDTLASEDNNVNSSNNTQATNLTQEVVNLKVAEYQAKASAEVIKTADENLGTLLDVTV